MTQNAIRLCPTCGRENAATILRCPCGALLTGVDLSSRAEPVAAPAPTQAKPETDIGPICPVSICPVSICPFSDCAQPNPPGSEVCVYCNRPLHESQAPETEPARHVFHLPRALDERYRVVEALPAGGAEAELFIVEPSVGGDERLVAKVYRHGIHPKPEVQKRLAAIDPAHKVRLIESGLSEGFTYELMEYCRHGSLRGLLRSGPLAPDRLREVAAELAIALVAVHEANLIHRDLKPENVLIRTLKPLDLVLTDFGIASVLDATLRFTGTARTLAYGAPETLAGILDQKADFWSLGMILLEATLGRHPFADLSDAVILHRLTTRPMDLAEVREPNLKKLLRGLLLRNPKARWGGDEIRRWLAGDADLREPADEADLSKIKPYRIGDESCFTPEQLAVALARHWTLAVSDLENGLLMTWFRQELQDQNLVRFLIDLNFDRQVALDLRLLRLLLYLAPGLPPVWRGESVGLGAILAKVGQALKGDQAAARFLVDLLQDRVLAAYAAAGNPEIGDLLQRWQSAFEQFQTGWQAAEARLRQRPKTGDTVYFDDVVYGQHAGLNPPPEGLVHARLLAMIYDEAWQARLRSLLQTEVARYGLDCPWLTELGQPADCPAAQLLVLHGLLPEARRQASKLAEKRTEAAAQARVQQRQLQENGVLALEELARAAQPLIFHDAACQELAGALDTYFALLAEVRALGSADEATLTLRNRLVRVEPYANRLRLRLDDFMIRRTENRGWLNRHTAQVVAGAVVLTILAGATRWLPWLMFLTALTLAWRLLPNFFQGRALRKLGRQVERLSGE